MKRLALFFLWTFVFLLLLVGFDQLVLRHPPKQTVLREIGAFYLDFRTRLLQLTHQGSDAYRPASAVLPSDREEESPSTPAAAIPSRGQQKGPAKDAGPGYVYADGEGNLQFADRLEEIPVRYRAGARPLDHP